MTAATPTPTPAQRRVLECLLQWQGMFGYGPTRAEIAECLGWKSANAAEDHLQKLSRSGFVTFQRGTARSIQLTPAALQLLGVERPEPGPVLIALPVVDMGRINRLAGKAVA